jgi:hypothetical protein
MRLYHFIHPDFALEAIGLRRLKISRIDQLNDPFEMLAGTQSDPMTRLAMRELRRVISARLGILCFSRDWHNPMLWSHYADRHRGLCLGFEVDEAIAMPVTYVAKRVPFDHYLDKATTEQEVRGMAATFASTKFSHWRYEQEVRCWASLDPAGPELQFSYFGEKMKLTHVYLGFRTAISRQMVEDALGDELASKVRVRNTRLAFRTFRVVTQHKPALWT